MHVDEPTRAAELRLRKRHRDGFFRSYLLFLIVWVGMALPLAACGVLFLDVDLIFFVAFVGTPIPLLAVPAWVSYARAKAFVRDAETHRAFAAAVVPEGEALVGEECVPDHVRTTRPTPPPDGSLTGLLRSSFLYALALEVVIGVIVGFVFRDIRTSYLVLRLTLGVVMLTFCLAIARWAERYDI